MDLFTFICTAKLSHNVLLFHHHLLLGLWSLELDLDPFLCLELSMASPAVNMLAEFETFNNRIWDINNKIIISKRQHLLLMALIWPNSLTTESFKSLTLQFSLVKTENTGARDSKENKLIQ